MSLSGSATASSVSPSSRIGPGNSIIKNRDKLIIKNKSRPIMMAADTQHQQQQEQQIMVLVLEQCDLCSAQYEQPNHIYAQPDLNRLICKILQFEPQRLPDGSSFLSQYIAVCSACALRVRRFDKLRIELDILRQEIISSVIDTIVHIRPDEESPLHSVKRNILDRWCSNGRRRSPSPTPLPRSGVSGGYSSFSTPTTQYVRSQNFGKGAAVNTFTTPSVTSLSPNKSVVNSNSVAATAAAVASIDPNSSVQSEDDHQNQTSWENALSGGEASVLTEGQGHELITNYVSDHILGDNEGGENEGGENEGEDGDNSGVGDNDVGVGDDDSDPEDSDSDYAPTLKVSTPKSKAKSTPSKSSPAKVSAVKVNMQASSNELSKSDAKPKASTRKSRRRASSYAQTTAPQHMKKPFICEGCGRVFSQLPTLRMHVKKKSCRGEAEMTPKRCSICLEDFQTLSWRALKFHIDEKHENIELEKCRFCRKEFLPSTMEHHSCRPVQSGLPKFTDFQCDYCDKKYDIAHTLSEHIRRVHPDKGKTYKCEICEQMFISEAIRLSHMRKHNTGTTAYSCKTCGTCLTTKWSLNQHMRVHTGERPHCCTICDRPFRLQTTLKNHMVIHSKEKNYTCDICGTAFGLYATMLRHWKSHITPGKSRGELCPVCTDGARFKKVKNLKRHMELRHPGTEEQIEICARPLDAVEIEDLRIKAEKDAAINKSALQRKSDLAASKRKREESDSEDSDLDEEQDLLNVKTECSTDSTSVPPKIVTRSAGKRVPTGNRMIVIVKPLD